MFYPGRSNNPLPVIYDFMLYTFITRTKQNIGASPVVITAQAVFCALYFTFFSPEFYFLTVQLLQPVRTGS